jgi:cyclopropane fatty-acyl-phospholipid synthase-like methyltransferase
MLSGILWNLPYLLGRPRWDTDITPPELVELVESGQVPPGRALDIGCGTGTNAIYLAQHGFEAVGTDIAWLAIRRARRKARDAGVSATFHVSEAIKLGTAAGPPVGGPFDLAVDIGCFHAIQSGHHLAYGSMLRRVLREGGYYLLYAWGQRKLLGRAVGLSPQETETLLTRDFERCWVRAGEEAGNPSYWYLFRRRPSSSAR